MSTIIVITTGSSGSGHGVESTRRRRRSRFFFSKFYLHTQTRKQDTTKPLEFVTKAFHVSITKHDHFKVGCVMCMSSGQSVDVGGKNRGLLLALSRVSTGYSESVSVDIFRCLGELQ